MSNSAFGRLGPLDGQPTRKAVVAIRNGYNKLVYCDAAPVTGPAKALVQVRAADVNNTEINTHPGWYSSAIRKGAA